MIKVGIARRDQRETYSIQIFTRRKHQLIIMFARQFSMRSTDDNKQIATTSFARIYWVVALCLLAASLLLSVSAFEETCTFQPMRIQLLRPHFCPRPRRCDLLFSRLEDGPQGDSDARVQHVEVQERGEPKSGTGMLFEWTTGDLVYSCMDLTKDLRKE